MYYNYFSGLASHVLLRSRSNWGMGLALLFLSIISAFIAFVVFKINLTKKARETKKLINTLGKQTLAWDYDAICNRANDVFYAFHKMLATGEKLHIKEFVTFEFYKDIENRFMLPAIKKRSTDKIRIKEITPVDVSDFEDDSLDAVWVYIKGDSTNCSIDAQIDASLAESDRNVVKHGEYWQFVRDDDNWLLNNIVYR